MNLHNRLSMPAPKPSSHPDINKEGERQKERGASGANPTANTQHEAAISRCLR